VLRHAQLAPYILGRPPRPQLLQAPIISASLCFLFDIPLLLVPQNHIHFPAN
jgi:hypothetical protein